MNENAVLNKEAKVVRDGKQQLHEIDGQAVVLLSESDYLCAWNFGVIPGESECVKETRISYPTFCLNADNG